MVVTLEWVQGFSLLLWLLQQFSCHDFKKMNGLMEIDGRTLGVICYNIGMTEVPLEDINSQRSSPFPHFAVGGRERFHPDGHPDYLQISTVWVISNPKNPHVSLD